MTYYPQSAVGLNYITYPPGPTAVPATVTSDAAANTKGLYTELAASTAFACNSIYVEITTSTLSTARRFLLDIAVGAASSEAVVIPNIIVEGGLSGSSPKGGFSAFFPLAIASGARISARCQDSSGGGTLSVAVTLIAAGDTPGCAAFTAHGADTATSNGVQVDPGATINTKGAYAELSASLGANAQYAVMIFHSNANTAPASANWSVDLATGAALSEADLVKDVRFSMGAGNEGFLSAKSYSFPTFIASGTRVSMRASCSVNDATDRLFRAALYTSVAPAEPSSGGAFSAAYIG